MVTGRSDSGGRLARGAPSFHVGPVPVVTVRASAMLSACSTIHAALVRASRTPRAKTLVIELRSPLVAGTTISRLGQSS